MEITAKAPRASVDGIAQPSRKEDMSAAKAPRLSPVLDAQPGWWCSLLGRRIGRPRNAPTWFNDPRCDAVNPVTGTQRGLTCGLFAVNHCLGRHGRRQIPRPEFQAVAGDGFYAEGDFDESGLRRNVERQGCHFERLVGVDHQEAVQQSEDTGRLAIFRGPATLGCIVHMPAPRHWISLVPPEGQGSNEEAALLCDSLRPWVYALTADEVADLFLHMASRQMRAGELALPLWQQEQMAAGWSAYRLCVGEIL